MSDRLTKAITIHTLAYSVPNTLTLDPSGGARDMAVLEQLLPSGAVFVRASFTTKQSNLASLVLSTRSWGDWEYILVATNMSTVAITVSAGTTIEICYML